MLLWYDWMGFAFFGLLCIGVFLPNQFIRKINLNSVLVTIGLVGCIASIVIHVAMGGELVFPR